MKTFVTLIMVAIFGLSNIQTSSAQDIHEIIKKFALAVDKYDQLEYKFESKERRRDGSYINTVGLFKVWEGPAKMVAANLTQPDVAKITWKKGENDNKASVKLGGLPFVNLPLTSSKFLAKSHHTIDNAGFGLPKHTIMKIYNDRKAEINEAVEIKGNVTFDGKTCLHIVITDKKFTTVNYTVKAGEDLISIAKARAINQMQILELNPDIKNYFDVAAGEVIKIPSSFGTKITIYFDTQIYLPRYFKVEDTKGIVGEYKHLSINLNPEFTREEFTKEGF
jgi:outer membrane lipoprotein-sorting protein